MKKKAIISALCVCLGSGFIGAVAWAGSIGQEAACTVASGKSILLCADVQDVMKGMGKKEDKQEEKKEKEAEAKEAKEKPEEGGGEQAAEARAEEAPKQASAERLTGGQTQAAEAPKAASNEGAQAAAEPASAPAAPAPAPAPEPKQPAHVHSYDIPVYETEQVYVVDQEAWTETVSEPVYDVVERSICSVCGADVTGNPAGHAKDHAMAGEGGGHYSDWQQVQVGTNTYTVSHPEQGHYESRSVVSGYQCSCGATQ